MKKSFKIFVLAIIFFAINLFLILQLIPVFESQTFGAKIINLIVFPGNFLFEDLFGITSVKFVDYITWILQFAYVYLIVFLIMKWRKNG